MITRKQLVEVIIPDLKGRFDKMLSQIRAVSNGVDNVPIVNDRQTMFWSQSDFYTAKNIKDCDAFAKEWKQSVQNLEAVTQYYVREKTNDKTKHYNRKITLNDLNKLCSEVVAKLQETELFTRRYYKTKKGQDAAFHLREKVQSDIKRINVSLKVYNGDLSFYSNYDFDFTYHCIEVMPLEYHEREKILEELDKIASCFKY